MTRKEIKEFGQHIADKLFHKKEQDNILVIKGWIARDENHEIYFYDKEPIKREYDWCADANIFGLNSNSFLQVSWEDDKPTRCELMIKIEK